MTMEELDRRYMALALSMGQRGLGLTWPNPSVGCVIVKDGRILGRACTQKTGRPHAEPQALAQAGPEARGATAYVTLEPCSHHGKTPPCAEALISAGIARVVIGISDPDPRVAGQGIALLEAAGIKVTTGILAPAATKLTEGFLSRITKGRPHITLKLATSFDGRIATATGESRWITGPEARRYVHRLRAISDAVMIGSGTAITDDPMLDVRPTGPKPVRIVLDRTLKLDPTSRLAASAKTHPLWLLHATNGGEDLIKAGADLLKTAEIDNRIALGPALELLAEKGLTRIFCEGGGTLAANLIAEGFVDRLITFTAGVALGADGIPSLAPISYPNLAQAPRFELEHTRQIGNDTVASWIPA